jgi:hypothetical protein
VSDVFINYRNGDEEASATLIEQDLSRRFGDERIFRASKSIDPGQDFRQALRNGVRGSAVLIAVIGSRWRALAHDEWEDDWTYREILDAFEHDIRVIPVLVGRQTPPLSKVDLPPEMAELADCQYRRFDNRNAQADLEKLAGDLARLVPGLVDQDKPKPNPSNVDNTTGDVSGSAIQARDITNHNGDGIGMVTGNSGTIINGAKGPVHTGSGDINAPQFSTDNVNYIAGDNSGGIHQQFGDSDRRKGDQR